MNRYNFSWKYIPLDLLSIPKSEKRVCTDYDELTSILSGHTIRIIKDASMAELRDDFCQFRQSPYSGYPELVHSLNRYEPLNYTEEQRKALLILQNIFPQFTKDLEYLKMNKVEWYDLVKHLTEANWKSKFTVTHQWTHTVNLLNCGHEVWYSIQLLYRAGDWLRGFKQSTMPKWNLPIGIFMYRNDNINYMSMHPGNSRNMFKDFDNVLSDVILISTKKDQDVFSDPGPFQYYDTEEKLKQLLEQKKVEYIIDKSGYVELFFLDKTQNSLNDETVLFFSEEHKTEYLNHCKQLIAHKLDRSVPHPNDKKFQYDLHIELKDRVIYYQGEKVAMIGVDGSINLFYEPKKYSFNLKNT